MQKNLHNCTVFGHVMIIFVLSVKQLNTLSHFKSLYLDENVSRIFLIFFLYLTKILKKNKQTKRAHTVLSFLSSFFLQFCPKLKVWIKCRLPALIDKTSTFDYNYFQKFKSNWKILGTGSFMVRWDLFHCLSMAN